MGPGIITFFNNKNSAKPNSHGHNSMGVLLPEGTFLYYNKRKVIKEKFERSKYIGATLWPLKDDDFAKKVFKYFTEYKDHIYLFKLGLIAFCDHTKHGIFDCNEIMPKFNSTKNSTEYEKAWDILIQKAKVGDAFFTFNTKSIISKLIARLDKGTWSHVAIYQGNGMITEAISRGTVLSNICEYKKPYYHVGLYSPIGMNERERIVVGIRGLLLLNKKYNYWGSMKVGLKTILGKGGMIPTPNGMIYRGLLPICFV
ncbi:MAG: hypothetical protein NT047_07455 [Deltaproteobacteria bacterium]|nr:hypothetical protein [Deltaproteobacteria bacterium]